MLQAPNLFLVGAPKSGTSSLASILGMHPKISLARFKEPQFFATDFRHRLVASPDEYYSLFSSAERYRYRLDATVTYMYSLEAIPNIARILDGVRILVILRDPMHMVPSWHSEMLLDFSETLTDFESAWNSIERRKLQKPVPTSCPCPAFLYYDEIAKYGAQLHRIFQCVPREHVHITLYDEFVSSPESACGAIWDFLGIEHIATEAVAPLNQRKVWRSKPLGRLARLTVCQNMKRRLLGVGRFSALAPLFFRKQDSPLISSGVATLLRDAYMDDLLVLEGILGRTLPDWLQAG